MKLFNSTKYEEVSQSLVEKLIIDQGTRLLDIDKERHYKFICCVELRTRGLNDQTRFVVVFINPKYVDLCYVREHNNKLEAVYITSFNIDNYNNLKNNN